MSTLLQAGVVDSISVANSPKSNYIYATYDSAGSAPGLHNIKILGGDVISDVPSVKSCILNQPTQRVIGARIQNTNNQSIPDATATTLTFNSIIYDTDGMADLANNRLTIQTPGLYSLNVFVRISVGAGRRVQSRIEVNANAVVLSDITSVSGTAGYFSTIDMFLNKGDNVTGVLYQNSDGSQSTSAGLGAPALVASMISTDFVDPVAEGTPLLCIRSKTTPLTIVDVLAGSTVESS